MARSFSTGKVIKNNNFRYKRLSMAHQVATWAPGHQTVHRASPVQNV